MRPCHGKGLSDYHLVKKQIPRVARDDSNAGWPGDGGANHSSTPEGLWNPCIVLTPMQKILSPFIVIALLVALSCTEALTAVKEGQWIRYRVMRADEWRPTPVDFIRLTAGPVSGKHPGYQWWKMEGERAGSTAFTICVLSESVPMSSETGDIGKVLRYQFRQNGFSPIEYVRRLDGGALLPFFGFREGLIPTPRSIKNRVGPWFGTGNYLGQPLSAQGRGSDARWGVWLGVKTLVLDDDFFMVATRWFKDDGTGPNEEGQYTYIDLDANDYSELFDAGLNLFFGRIRAVNHLIFLREQPVFFTSDRLQGKDGYPELLYRSNFYGARLWEDEPKARQDSLDARTLYDAVNLLRMRNHTYFRSSGRNQDDIVEMIKAAGFSLGDFNPQQTHVPVWDTYPDTAFYQMQGGAAGMVHEARYRLEETNNILQGLLGSPAQLTVEQMLNATYATMRGSARIFEGDWGAAIYGQMDPTLAVPSMKAAWDQGARYSGFWSSDHDHHVPFVDQVRWGREFLEYRRNHPRASRDELNRKARIAVAAPEGYIGHGHWMWWSARFQDYRFNEKGVRYGDVASEVVWQTYLLASQNIPYDLIVDHPDMEKGAYEKIIRVYPDGTTSEPRPALSPEAPTVTVVYNRQEQPVRVESRGEALKAWEINEAQIRVDGSFADWKGAEWFELDQKLLYEDALPHAGNEDLSARAALAFSNDALYLAIEVTDDIHRQDFDGDDIWRGDSIQLGIHPLLQEAEEGFYAQDGTELGLALVGGEAYAHIWEQQTARALGPAPEVQASIVREGSLTRYEARIPYQSMHPFTPDYPGRARINLVVNDSDGMSRKGALALSSGLADGKDLSLWRVMEFKAARPGAPPALMVSELERGAKQGGNVEFLLTSGAGRDTDTQLLVRVRQERDTTETRVNQVKLKKGMHSHNVRLDTSGLAPGSYWAEFEAQTGGRSALKKSVRFYVFP